MMSNIAFFGAWKTTVDTTGELTFGIAASLLPLSLSLLAYMSPLVVSIYCPIVWPLRQSFQYGPAARYALSKAGP